MTLGVAPPTRRVFKLGRGLAITLPAAVAREMGITRGDVLTYKSWPGRSVIFTKADVRIITGPDRR